MVEFAKKIKIGNREVGEGCPVFFIAEAGVAHFGSEEKAYRLIDLAVEAGADAVKFQTFDVKDLFCEDMKEWRDRLGSRQLSYEAFGRLQAYCKEKGILFFSTAHDEPALDFLTTLDPPCYKIGSGEVGNWPYLRKIASLGKPVIFSVGMYTQEQIAEAIKVVADTGNTDIAVLHCVTRYPTPPEEVSLGNMAVIRDTHKVITGYSDHTVGYHIPLAAVAMGAKIIEKHFSLDFNVPNAQDWRVSVGPDDPAVWPYSMKSFVREIREIEASMGTRLSGPTEGELTSKAWAGKSLMPRNDIAAGTVLTEELLMSKRPGTGISPSQIDAVLGKKAKTTLPADKPFNWDDLV